MTQTPAAKRFRTNPVEIVIFLAISGIFAHSVYQLFYDSSGFKSATLAPMISNPLTEGRSPASISQSFINLDVRCDHNPEQETTAHKIRLSGPLCGMEAGGDSSKFSKVTVTNQANRFNATIFTDTTADKFSTDYIPLNAGKNSLHLEFAYRSGKTLSQDVLITKN